MLREEEGAKWSVPKWRKIGLEPGTHFFSDLLPDDPRHLVTVQFNDRVFHHNLVSYNASSRDETGG